MDWGLLLHIVSTLVVVAISWGILSTRVNHLEKLVEELRTEVKDFRKLNEDIAVVKNDIHSIREMMSLLMKKDKE